jgi:hypothetical protein
MKTTTTSKLINIRLKLKNINTTNHIKTKPQLCPHCLAELIRFSDDWTPPICENPVCPLNNYTPKGHS